MKVQANDLLDNAGMMMVHLGHIDLEHLSKMSGVSVGLAEKILLTEGFVRNGVKNQLVRPALKNVSTMQERPKK